MDDRIIYLNEEGGIGIVTPSGELSTIETARKDVPKGFPFRIISASDLPEDFTFRRAWVSDFSNPDGYGIGQEEWFAEQELKKFKVTL